MVNELIENMRSLNNVHLICIQVGEMHYQDKDSVHGMPAHRRRLNIVWCALLVL